MYRTESVLFRIFWQKSHAQSKKTPNRSTHDHPQSRTQSRTHTQKPYLTLSERRRNRQPQLLLFLVPGGRRHLRHRHRRSDRSAKRSVVVVVVNLDGCRRAGSCGAVLREVNCGRCRRHVVVKEAEPRPPCSVRSTAAAAAVTSLSKRQSRGRRAGFCATSSSSSSSEWRVTTSSSSTAAAAAGRLPEELLGGGDGRRVRGSVAGEPCAPPPPLPTPIPLCAAYS